ncbi:hypothetical protein SMICM17S_00395 [Streptomyces microflavus]
MASSCGSMVPVMRYVPGSGSAASEPSGSALTREPRSSPVRPVKRRVFSAPPRHRRSGALGDDPARVDDRDVVGECLGLVHEVGGQHHGDPVSAQLAHQVPGGAAGLRVQPGGRLVQEDQLGPADDREGQGEALLAAGEPAVGGAAAGAEAEAFDQGVHVQRVGVELRHVAEHLVGPGAGVDATRLEHHPDAGAQPLRFGDRVESGPVRCRVGRRVALAGLDRGGLPGAVRAEHGRHRARRDVQIEAVHRGPGAVPLHQSLDLYDGLFLHGA